MEEIILARGKQKDTIAFQKIKSTSFFTGFKTYLNANETLKKNHLGIYDFELALGDDVVNYQFDIAEKAIAVRKKKTTKPLVKVVINDENLINLHKKKLLLDEVIIQG